MKQAIFDLRRLAVSLLAACFATGLFAQVDLNPIPDYYQDPGISPNRNYINQNAGEHVDPFTGKLQFHLVDLFLPGNGGMDIKVQRSYSSLDAFVRDAAPFGVGWTVNFGRIIGLTTGQCVPAGSPTVGVIEMPDGSRHQLFAADSTLFSASDLATKTGLFVTKDLYKTQCSPSGTGLTVFTPDGTQYNMDVAGPTITAGSGTTQQSQASLYPSSIVDRNGNTLNLTYGNFGPYFSISTVSAPDGRKVTFTYDAGGNPTGVTDGTRTVQYHVHPVAAIPGYVFLDTVTRPDGTTWKYTYNEAFNFASPIAGQGSISSVTYPTGGTYSYTYALQTFYPIQTPASHVISTKTASGSGMPVGSGWTFTYTPSSTAYPPNAQGTCASTTSPYFDLTTITGPEGTQYLCHFGYMSAYGNNLTTVGYAYAIGESLGRVAGPDAEGVWNEPMLITKAQQTTYPGGVYQEDIATPILQTQNLYRDGQSFATAYSNYDQYGNPGTVSETGAQLTVAGAVAGANPGGTTRTTTFTYYVDPVKWVLHAKATEAAVVDGVALGQIQRSFDANANVLSENRYGVTTSWTYFPTGDIQTKTDALGNTILYSNYQLGIPQAEQYPLQAPPGPVTSYETISRVVDNFGNVTSQTDGAGAVTGYQYDGLNRLIKITHPIGNPVTVAWTSNSRTVRRGAFTETTNYDGFGRKSSVVALDTATTDSITRTYFFDALGRMTFESDPNSTVGTEYVYDQIGRETARWFACNAPPPAGCLASRTTSYGGVAKVVTDELAFTSEYLYRGYGDPDRLDLIGIRPPYAEANTTITRNGLGQIASVLQGGQTRSYSYSPSFFLTSSVDPETGTTTYGRDAIGNMTSRQVGASGITTFVYDGLNRLTNTNFPTGTPSVSRTYYLDNKIETIDNGTAQRSFVYDANKNLTSETLTLPGANQTFTTGYSYNANDALSTITYGSGQVVSYYPDNFNRPTMAYPFTESGSVSYFSNGMIESYATANGMHTTYTQNARLWPDSMVVTNGVNPVLNSQYEYDNAGNLSSITDAIDPAQNRTISYDALQRVGSVQGSPWGTIQYAYDGTGNITEKIQTNIYSVEYFYGYDSQNRLSGLSSMIGNQINTLSTLHSYSYDTYGNITGNGQSTLSYDDASNLTCSNCGTSKEVDYQYDGQGLRVSSTPVGGNPTYFAYASSGNLLSEFTPGQVLKEYIYFGGRQIAVRQADESTGGTPTASVNLTVAGSANPTSVVAGGSVTYTVNVSNNGTQDASGVSVVNVLPPQVTYVSASPGCSNASGTVTCSIGALAASAQSSIQIQATTATPGTWYDVSSVVASLPNSSGVNGTAFVPLSVH